MFQAVILAVEMVLQVLVIQVVLHPQVIAELSASLSSSILQDHLMTPGEDSPESLPEIPAKHFPIPLPLPKSLP